MSSLLWINSCDSKDIFLYLLLDNSFRFLFNRVCEEEEAEEGHEFRVSARDEYYQENAREAREKFCELPKYDIDEYWCAIHVLQTQYTLQIVRCNSVECCGPWRSNYIEVFPHRFLPSPVPFERTPYGIRMAEKDYQKGQFYGSLFQRIQFHGVVIAHTQVKSLLLFWIFHLTCILI